MEQYNSPTFCSTVYSHCEQMHSPRETSKQPDGQTATLEKSRQTVAVNNFLWMADQHTCWFIATLLFKRAGLTSIFLNQGGTTMTERLK